MTRGIIVFEWRMGVGYHDPCLPGEWTGNTPLAVPVGASKTLSFKGLRDPLAERVLLAFEVLCICFTYSF